MKKIIIAAAVALTALTASFAEGWTLKGYARAGAEGNFDAKDLETSLYKDGKYYGNGKSRVQMNMDYNQQYYGFNFRYQVDGFGFQNTTVKDATTGVVTEEKASEVWFTQTNLKYVMAYAKFIDEMVIVEVGKLGDNYTASEGREAFNICSYSSQQSFGVRTIINPIEGLYFAVGASSYRADRFEEDDDSVKDKKVKLGDLELNQKVLGFSTKYKNKNFCVAGGYNLGGEGFGYLGLSAVPNLKFYIEGRYIDKEVSGKTDKNGDKTSHTVLSENLLYNFTEPTGVPLETGIMMYQTILKDNSQFEFYPYLSYGFTKSIFGEFEVGVIKYMEPSKHKDREGDDQSVVFNVTPSVKFKAGPKATVKVYYNYDKLDKHAAGCTARINF